MFVLAGHQMIERGKSLGSHCPSESSGKKKSNFLFLLLERRWKYLKNMTKPN